MARGRTAGAAVAAFAVVVGLVIVYRSLGSRELEAPRGNVEESRSRVAEGSSSSLEAASIPGARTDTAREAIVGDAGDRAEESKPESPSGTATLQLLVFETKTRAPLKGIRVLASKQKDHSGRWMDPGGVSFRGDLEHPPVTDEDGQATLVVPAGFDLRVWARDEDGNTESKTLDVPMLRAGEERELRIDLLLGDDLVLFGKVVDAANAPIGGAAVRVCVGGAFLPGNDHRDRNSEILSRATADADGLFEVHLPSWRRPFVRVEAAGHAFAVVRRCAGHETPDRAVVVPLSTAASVKARIVDTGGRPVPDVRITFRAEGYALPIINPEWAGEYVDVPGERWVSSTGEDGTCTLDEICPALPVEVELRKGDRLLRREQEPIVLQPGQVLEREWVLGEGCTLSGLALDQDGKPVPKLELWLCHTGLGPSNYFEAYAKDRVSTKTSTDADGRFAMPDVAPGTWLLGPAPLERAWTVDASGNSRRKDTPADAIAALGQIVDVPDAPSLDLTLHVFRGLFIRGKVLDPGGNGTESDVVAMTGKDAWGPQTQSASDGTFAVGPLAAGRYSVVATATDEYVDSDPVEAEAGASDLVLRLKAGGGLRGRIIDARTGNPCEAEALLTPHVAGPGIYGEGVGFGVREDGVLERKGLAPGNYDLAARSEDGAFGILSGIGVVVGEPGKEFVLSLAPGGALKLRYEGSHPFAQVDVRLQGVRIDWGTTVEPGTTVDRRAPAGTFTLEVRLERDAPPRTRTVHLDPGETKEIRIRDDD